MLTQVFHTRLSRFAVQAERLVDPTLVARPLAVITSPAQNGTILDLSDEARAEGLVQGMRVSLARKVSRIAVLQPFNAPLYQKVQGMLFQRLVRFSPAVEPAGYGSFFLDMTGMTGLYRSLDRAGHLLAKDVAAQLDLRPRVGIGRNKLVTAIATRVTWDDPVLEVPTGDEPEFLAPLRSMILPIAREKLVHRAMLDLNLLIVQDIQQLIAREFLREVVFGAFARRVATQVQGIDTSMVKPAQLGASADRIIERYALPEDTNNEDSLHGAVQRLSETVGWQLRRSGRIARRITLQVHYTDGYESRATGRLERHDALTVMRELVSLYRRANRRRSRVRAITVDADGLQSYADQLSLFGSPARPEERQERITTALDHIRQRHGSGSVLPLSALPPASQHTSPPI
jgi:DNA polymerase-4